jgi:hypothetical protein
MSPLRKRMAIALSTCALLAAIAPNVSLANPSPPTNGGNGAGHSGQCTGNPDDRPASCH